MFNYLLLDIFLGILWSVHIGWTSFYFEVRKTNGELSFHSSNQNLICLCVHFLCLYTCEIPVLIGKYSNNVPHRMQRIPINPGNKVSNKFNLKISLENVPARIFGSMNSNTKCKFCSMISENFVPSVGLDEVLNFVY